MKFRSLLAVLAVIITISAWGRDIERVTIAGTECLRCEVQRGENIYTLAREFGVSTTVITRFNPTAADGLRPGMRIYIPVKELPESTGDNETQDTTPVATFHVPAVVETTSSTDEGESPYGTSLENDTTDYSLIPSEQRITDRYVINLNDDEAPEYHIAIVLPFMLETPVNKQSQLYTEFYKGFLMAADSLRNETGMRLTIHAYDSCENIDSVQAIAQLPEMSSMNLIVGPDNEMQLASLAATGRPVLNIFNARSTLYENTHNILQANIPHQEMYRDAVDAFSKVYAGYRPVFLARIDGAAEKDAFINLLKERLDNDSIPYETITFKNLLTLSHLDSIADGNTVFIPLSGARTEFSKISEAIHRFKQSRTDWRTGIWGYPDWITFRGDYFTRLCELDAVIYTRFYADKNDESVAWVMNCFKALYGCEMLDAAPIQGLLGFDTAMYILTTLRDNDGDFMSYPGNYTGLQSLFNFDGEASGSKFNQSLFMVTFSPDGIYKEIIP